MMMTDDGGHIFVQDTALNAQGNTFTSQEL